MALLGDKQARPLRKYMLEQNLIKTMEAFPQKDNPLNRVFLEAKLPTCIYVTNKFFPDTFTVRVHPGKDILETSPQIEISNNDIKVFDAENLSIPSCPGVTNEDFKLAVKLNNVVGGAKLGLWAPSQQGEVNLTSHKQYLSSKSIGPVVLRGAHIGRYEFQEQPKQGEPAYLNVEPFLKEHGSDTKAHDYNNIRIGYQRGSAIDNWRRIISTVIEPGNFCTDTINYILNPTGFDLLFILAILNSHLLEWRFKLTSTNNHVNAYEIDSLPIPRIAFVTPEKEREKLVAHAKKLYQEDFEAFPDVLMFVEERLTKKHKPNSRFVTIHNADPINKDWQIPEDALWEQSDVVHDILAFLAKQMIEMNKEKQTEIKGFLEWLERQCKTKIDELKNKTRIKNYHKHSFEELLDVLKDNVRSLQVNMNREFEERIKSEFEKSIAKLNPLKERIEKTDWLIDQIVYRLYGLTEDEINVVENK